MKKLFTFFTITSLVTIISFPSFSQQSEQLSTTTRVYQSGQKTSIKKKGSIIGFFGRLSIGFGWAYNRERPCTYHDPYCTDNDDGQYRLIDDISDLEEERDTTYSTFRDSLEFPIDL